MAQILRPPIRLSQNEIDCILANEKAKWRKFRIQQVRAQSKEEAFKVREARRKEEENQKERIKKEVNTKWESEKQRKIKELEKKLQKDYKDIGEAHQRAQIENEALQAFDRRRKNDHKVAAKRGQKALLALDKEKSVAIERDHAIRLTKKTVMQKEKKRAAKISKLSTPVKFKALKKTQLKPPKKVMFHEAGTLTTSSYIPSKEKVKIIKEGKHDQDSGKETAKRENEKYEEMKALKKQEEEKNNRKIEERGKQAIKREKTKEMYSHLMSQLDKAEENNELSDYLKEEENFDSLAIETYLRRERETAAEEKAKRVLAEELDTVPVKLVSDSSKEESESSIEKPFTIGVESFNSDKSVSVLDEADNVQLQMKSPLLQSKDIHFKETVPVHELPIIRERFLVRVPVSDQSQSVTPHSSEESKFTSESYKSDSSVEEHKTKPKYNSLSEFSFRKSRSLGEKTESDATSYHKPPQTDKMDLICKGRSHSEISISPLSSVITKYLKPPPAIRDSELNNESLLKNLKDIQERNKKLENIVSKFKKKDLGRPSTVITSSKDLQRPSTAITSSKDLQRPSTAITSSKEELSSFKTPPNIYTEALKNDSIGLRPVSKREKFEHHKKKILQIYMRRLLQIKQRELKEVTASTVEGSGIDVSSSDSNLLELLQVMNISSSDMTLSTTPTITSDLLNRLSRIGFVPSDISTPKSSTLNAVTSDRSMPSLGTSTSTPLQTDNSEHLSPPMVDIDMKKQILLRLVELQKLKQECIRRTKFALQNQKTSLGEKEEFIQESLSHNGKISEISGSSLDWGSNNYETPPREISTQSWSEFSDFSSHQRRQQHQQDAVDSVLQEQAHKEPLGLGEYSDSVKSFSDISNTQRSVKHDDYKQYVSLEKEIKALADSAQKLKATMEPIQYSNGESSPISLIPGSQRDSSSFSSLPDMDEIIRRIGLGWAQSMATKMDKAEEVKTSDYSE